MKTQLYFYFSLYYSIWSLLLFLSQHLSPKLCRLLLGYFFFWMRTCYFLNASIITKYYSFRKSTKIWDITICYLIHSHISMIYYCLNYWKLSAMHSIRIIHFKVASALHTIVGKNTMYKTRVCREDVNLSLLNLMWLLFFYRNAASHGESTSTANQLSHKTTKVPLL